MYDAPDTVSMCALWAVSASRRSWGAAYPLMSPDRLIDAILKVHDLSSEAFGWPRALVLPAVQVDVREMLDALEEIAGPEARSRVTFKTDDRVLPMVRSWPAEVTSERASRLGIETDADAMSFVRQYALDQGIIR